MPNVNTRESAVVLSSLNGINSSYAQTGDFNLHYGLGNIRAEAAYRRGYFGQGVTIAVGDDGMDIRHPDLNVVKAFDIANGGSDVSEHSVMDIHGTFVGLIAAGRRNDGAMSYTVRADDGGGRRTDNFHGVAPESPVIALELHGGGNIADAVRIAAREKAKIVNFSLGVPVSYYGEIEGREGGWFTVDKPIFFPFLSFTNLNNEINEAAGHVGDADIVFVWAAGNDSWRHDAPSEFCVKSRIFPDPADEDGCRLGRQTATPAELLENFIVHQIGGMNLPNPIKLADAYRNANAVPDPNDPGGWAHAPYLQNNLLGKWLVVGSVNQNTVISRFSNGCGLTKNWCLVAPGEGLRINNTEEIDGTSFAAPHVSGALAVLKSRFPNPNLPMEIVQAILLTSATPLGNRITTGRPDDVYGWGLVNLENAINMQGSLTLALPLGFDAAASLQNFNIRLPAHFSHLKKRLQTAEVAAGGVGGAYFNLPLSGLATIESAPAVRLGGGAADMLRAAGGGRFGDETLFAAADLAANRLRYAGADLSFGALGGWRLRGNLCEDCQKSAWREWNGFNAAADIAGAPFFAAPKNSYILQMQGGGVRPFAAFGETAGGNPWRQFGARWRGEYSRFRFLAEVSQTAEPETVLGAYFGAPAATGTQQASAFLHADFSPLRGFFGYQAARAKARGAGVFRETRNLRAAGWQAGAEMENLFLGGDALRFTARRKTAIQGAVGLRLTEARGSFAEAFYNGAPQELAERDAEIDLSGGGGMQFLLGYTAIFSPKIRWAAAAEYDAAADSAAFSARLEMDF